MPALRQAHVSDHGTIVECVQRWWGDSRTPEQARELSLLLPKLFLQFFSATSLVLQDGTDIRAFLVGFYAADNDTEAYIHFVGVDPKLRGQGIARDLYAAFFQRAAEAGRTEVRAITSPKNAGSIAFHRAMGFTLESGDREVDRLPIHTDYDGPGQDRVCFYKKIAPRSATTTSPNETAPKQTISETSESLVTPNMCPDRPPGLSLTAQSMIVLSPESGRPECEQADRQL